MKAGVSYSVNTGDATSDDDPIPSCSSDFGNGVWYSFTPSASGPIIISTCGSDYDTVLAVYTGTCGSLTELANSCNDDAGPVCDGNNASVRFTGIAGKKYLILAGGKFGITGVLNVMVMWPVQGLTIIPWFNDSVINDPNATAIETTINNAISAYQTNFSDPITVNIGFEIDTSVDLAASGSATPVDVDYVDYLSALATHATTADDKSALSHLPASAGNPVTGDPMMTVRCPLARALGLTTVAPQLDGVIYLNIDKMNFGNNYDRNNYSLFSACCHEMDEILGFSSALNHLDNYDPAPTGAVAPEDLFRYDVHGNRSFTTDPNAISYFSFEGIAMLARFNQNEQGDMHDWYSTGPHVPQVQDAFAYPGVQIPLGVELRVLDAIGFNRALGGRFFRIGAATEPTLAGTVVGDGVKQFGSKVTLSVKPNQPGYGALYWMENGNIVSTNSTYSFVVTSNRSITAYVSDITAPTFAVISPAENARVFTSTTNITGHASDNSSVWEVEVQSNDGLWQGAQSDDGFAHWSASVDLLPGTNIIRTIAYDGFGNYSRTNVRHIFYSVPSPLTVSVNGNGKVSPNFNGQLLEIGRGYSITAIPSNHWVFSNWSGDISANTATLHFLMQSNLNLQANFVTNPFITLKGTYNGLFYESDVVRENTAGFFTFVLKDNATFSGKLTLAGIPYPLTGKFDLFGNSQVVIPRTHTTPLTINLNLDMPPVQTDQVHGAVVADVWNSTLNGDRAVFDGVTTKATDFAGKYTLAILGDTNGDATLPSGDGYATFSISSAGNILMSGMLADGTPISQSVPISKNGEWPFFASLYGGKGLVLGRVEFSGQPASTLSGDVTWIKPANRLNKSYTNGFALSSAFLGSSFQSGTNTLAGFNPSVLTLSAGNLTDPLAADCTLGAKNNLIVAGTNNIIFIVNPLTGMLSTSHFTDPTTHHVVPLNGVVLQNQQQIRGYFLDMNESGSLFVQPQ